MHILVLNCTSSSMRFALYNCKEKKICAKGTCLQIGFDSNSSVSYHVPDYPEQDLRQFVELKDHETALQVILALLTEREHGVILSERHIDAVGHFVKHGGEKMSSSVFITDEVKAAIRECFDLAPLHNPANLVGIEVAEKLLPNASQIAVFDTAFFSSMPDFAYMYALPDRYYKKFGLRKYGTHGITAQIAFFAMLENRGYFKHPKTVICDIGNTTSVSAVKDGKGFDTVDLIGATRSGQTIDPAVIPFLMEKEHLYPDEMRTVLEKESGFFGLMRGEGGADYREVNRLADKRNERAKLSQDMLCHQIVKAVGGFAASMSGLDAIIFTGTAGVYDSNLRVQILKELAFLGAQLDDYANSICGRIVELSRSDSRVQVFSIPVDEAVAVALETRAVLEQKGINT